MNRPIALVAGALIAVSCQTNPYTGRSQLMLLDRDQELQLGAQAYQEALAAEPQLTRDPAYAGVVERVAGRLAEEIEKGWDDIRPPRFTWEFSVIDKPGVANAWCLPGGKIAVYTGIFPKCRDENGLAVVLGHEIMHAVLHHGNERVSQSMLGDIGTTVLASAIGQENERKKKIAHGLLGLGLTVGVLLPYSRENESEADKLGLLLAARAGYDPRAAVEVWTRMRAAAGNGGMPEFLSTHPDPGTRIKNMEEWMPEAMALYEKSNRQSGAALPAPGSAHTGVAPEEGDVLVARSVNRRPVGENSGMVVEFAPLRDVHVETIGIEGPLGLQAEQRISTGIPAEQIRSLTLSRRPGDGDLPPGKYVVRFQGHVNGASWSQSLEFTLR